MGEATADRLASEGFRVVVADRDLDRARAVADRLGGRGEFCDVSEPDSVDRAVYVARELGGDLRVVVNCAGVATPGKLIGRTGATPVDDFAKTINVNLMGTINALSAAADAMRENDPGPDGHRGIFVATASIAAYDGQIGQIAYAASKGGVVSLTLPAARELARYGIRVVTIAPGLFDTPLLAGLPADARESLEATVPFPSRLGDPGEFAELVWHAVCNRMLNGAVLRLDGALRMAPK